jgi:hypothetical protein
MTDDDWPEPEPWGWRGHTLSIGVILALAVVLYATGWHKTKRPVVMEIMQYRIGDKFCHAGRFYYDGITWRCL